MTALCEVPRPLSELTASAGHCPWIKSALQRTAAGPFRARDSWKGPPSPSPSSPHPRPHPVASRQPRAPPLWGSGLGRGSGTGGDQPHLSPPPRPGQRQRRPLPGPGLRGPSGQSGLRSSVVSPLEGGREAALALLSLWGGERGGIPLGVAESPSLAGGPLAEGRRRAGGIAREGGRGEKSASRSRTVGRGRHQGLGGWRGEVTRGSCRLLRPSPHSRDWGWSYLIGQSWGAQAQGPLVIGQLQSTCPCPSPRGGDGTPDPSRGEGSPLPGLGVALLKLLTAHALPGSVRTPHLPPALGRQAPRPGTPVLLRPQFSRNQATFLSPES